jgi:hypothetical protein
MGLKSDTGGIPHPAQCFEQFAKLFYMKRYPASSIQHPESRIQNPASRITHPASSIQHHASRITHH